MATASVILCDPLDNLQLIQNSWQDHLKCVRWGAYLRVPTTLLVGCRIFNSLQWGAVNSQRICMLYPKICLIFIAKKRFVLFSRWFGVKSKVFDWQSTWFSQKYGTDLQHKYARYSYIFYLYLSPSLAYLLCLIPELWLQYNNSMPVPCLYKVCL